TSPNLELIERGRGKGARGTLETFERDIDVLSSQFFDDIQHRIDPFRRAAALCDRERGQNLRRELQEIIDDRVPLIRDFSRNAIPFFKTRCAADFDHRTRRAEILQRRRTSPFEEDRSLPAKFHHICRTLYKPKPLTDSGQKLRRRGAGALRKALSQIERRINWRIAHSRLKSTQCGERQW